ncbi:hypothetical protein Tco_0250408 [Tanacetum coccineum]
MAGLLFNKFKEDRVKVLGVGHMARQCTQLKRPRNAAWFKEKLMLAEAQEFGQVLDEEQLKFLTDPGITDCHDIEVGFMKASTYFIIETSFYFLPLFFKPNLSIDDLLERVDVDNFKSARLSNKFWGFYFIFKFGISGSLYYVVTAIADRIQGDDDDEAAWREGVAAAKAAAVAAGEGVAAAMEAIGDAMAARECGIGYIGRAQNPKLKELLSESQHDEEIALKLQKEIDKEERIARGEEEMIDEANIALTEEWDDIQAKIEADHELAQRLQAEEQEELSVEEKAELFQQLLEKRRKHFAAKRAEEQRNKPPTQAQQRTIITDLVEGSLKRAGEKLEQENTKKQKVDEDKDTTKLQSLMKVILDEEEVAIDVVTLATKPPTIVDWKIHKEGRKSYY